MGAAAAALTPAVPAFGGTRHIARITTSGTSLRAFGAPFPMYGASVYGQIDTAAKRAAVIDLALQGRLNTVRVVNWLHENSTTPDTAAYDSTRWKHCDALIAAASRAGLRVILDLSTYRNLLLNGGKVNPYGRTQYPRWEKFIAWVLNRRNSVTGATYANDPTIAYVAIAGEPAAPKGGDALRPTTAELTAFYKRAAAKIRAKSRVLICPGGFLFLDWDSGIDWKAIGADASIDMLALHPYSDGDRRISVPAMGAWSAAVNKPWLMEEFGAEVGRTTDADRAALFQNAYDQADTHSAAAAAFWNLGPATTGATYDVNTAHPVTWATVRANSSKGT